MSLIIDVISRKTSVKQTLINPGDVTVVIYEPSVVQVHAQASAVARYVREGNDLLIYMQDGTVIRCNGYFLQAANTAEQSELVFADGQQLTHVTFADTAAGGLAPVELTAQTTAIESIAPYLDIVGQTTAFPWGWLAGAAVGGGALGALLASGGDDDSKTEVVNNPPPAEPGNATPSFLVTDNQGDQRGILSANDTTDDTTPTFSGSGQAGATIQIKDSNGDTIASTQVGSDGRWSVDLPTQSAGEHTWSVVQIVGSTITDAGSITLTIDNSQASVQVATTAGDNIINASEQAAGFTLSGTSSHLAQGTELTVTLNGKTYTTSVGANGAWSVQVPTADAQALGEGNQAVLVSGKDATGNTVTGVQLLTVDTQPPTLAINTIAHDNIISAAEHNVALVLSGTSNAEAGQTVTLTVNGKSHSVTVGSDGTWQVTLPATEVQALAEGNYAVNASVSDRAGNTTSNSANFTVDTSAPVVSVNTVAGDDILNNAEQAVAQIISGQVSGASPGDTVTVKLGTHVLTGIVLADGSWNVALDPAVTRTLDRGANTIFVTVTDAAGNTGAASRAITLVGVSPLITINTVSGDDIISGAEKGAPLTLTGSTQQAETGQTVTVTLAGQSFTTTVQADGSWSLTVPAAAMGNLPDGAVAITASVTDLSGNTGDTSRTITVDSQAPALGIDPLTPDNIINAAESGQDLQITGTTDAQPGQTVTVTLNGQTYQGVVQSDGTWSVTVPAANVDALADGNATVTASVNDVAGNPTSVSRVALVDATPPVVTINPVATDNVINTPEHTQAQIISGTVTGAQAGDIVTVTLNNVDYTTVVDASGNWSLGVPASVVSGLVDGSYPINVSVTDRAGNMGSQSLTVTVDTAAPVIGINTIAGDDVINASEKGADVQITGTSDQPVNTTITVTLNGQNYTTTTDSSGNWSVTVPASAVTALGQANYTVTAAVTSSIGNSATASHNVLVDSALPGVTINPVATDDIINAAEAGVAQTISGQVTGAEDGDTVTITLGGNTYTATVGSNLTWSVSVPAADIQALGNGDLTVSASVTNQNGNTGSGTRDITIDANLPGLRVDTVAGDDVVNIIEHGQALVVTGSSSGLAEGTPLTVTINNVEYTTAVQADGSWSVGVTAAQVSAWPAGTVNIAVSGESSAENPVSITHPVTVDLTPAAITINTIATDDVINAAEKGANLTLSGTTTNVEPGQTVTVTFGGKNYTASVASDGSWTATVPAADLAALPEGSASAQASVSNINGNSASAVHNYSVDSSAPTIIINTVASDNIVNASEADAGVTVSGSTTAEAGQIVTITLNSPTVQTYQATVQADGSWSINILAADLEALTDGSHTLTATVNDKAGNPASTTHNLAVDLTVPVLTINTIAGDDIINAAEHGQALVISGSSTGGEVGDVVSVTLNSKTYTTTLDASGNWSVGVPAADVTALGSGPQTVTATVTDAAGNSDSETHTVTVNLTAPTIGINTIATDDVINATEKGADLQISGTSNQPAGTTITVTLNGQNYTATTDASGNWSTTVPASAVGALGEASYTVTANVTDSAGNSNSASHNVQVNTALPGVTLNPVASDDIINAAELGVAQTISGQVTGAAAGDTVTVTLGGKTYTATVQGNLSWSVDVPAADIQAIGNGDLTVNASVTNGVGNTGSGSRDIVIDANLPGLRVDTVAGDDVVNSIEHGQALVITGSSSGLAAGAALTVVINNVTYGATVLADGTWSLGVPAADVGNWPAGTVNITVSGATSAGNPVTITHPVTVDLAAVAISINTVSGDDVINAAEKSADLTLSGSTSGVEAGQTVTVTFGGKTYTATVAGDGSWTTIVPAADLSALRDGDASVQASVSNVNGNTASATHAYSVDATAPTLAINTIATDDILNAAEAGNPLTISGSSTAEAGQTVTVTLNGVTYTGTVQADGSWSVSVPTADLSNLTASQYTVSASVSDKAGNPATATHGLAVDLTVPVLTINTVSGDDIINAAEHGQALVISGSSTGGEAGDVITVTLNSKTYTTTLDASGNWSVGVPAADVTALGSGPQTITAAITDAAGNSDDASRTVTVNLTAPTIGINTIASDDVINATEKGADLQITGTSNQPAGTTITVTLNGQNYTATTDSSGNWSATVPASAVSALGEANYTVTANVTDSAGNSNSASHNVLVNSALPAVTINAVATDDIINDAESGNAQTISGQVTGAAAGDTVTVTLGGNTYTATVQANLSWSVSVPAADIQALGNGDLTVNASVTNGVGNTGNGSRDITIDANLPGLRVDTVAGDDVINSIEHNQALVITGSSSGLTAGTALTVEINNVTYGATVLADGTWSLGIPAADVSNWPAGTVDITVSGTNSAGTTSTITHPVTVDLAAVAITINTLSGDDVINAVEKGETLVVSGSTSGVEAGQTVTVTFGGKSYTTTVEANGSWTVNVPPADLASLPDGAGNVQASVSNINGNSAQADRAYSVDATAPLVTINTIASDDILNVSEAGAGITISGTSTAETGQTVTVTLNGATYSGNVQADGSWSVSVPPSALGALTASNYTVSATVNDKAGNPGSASHNLAVDTTAPVLTINTVAGDDIINDAEHAQALVISGTSTGGEAGDVVSVVLNGKTYTSTLDASGNWSVGVPAADVTALGSGAQTITASVSDRAGNSDDASRTVTVSLSAPVISINTIAGDDVINATEKGSDLALSGTSDQPAGTAITVTLNGQNYSATTDASGNWSVTVPASAVSALGEATYSVTASVTNAQGNSSTASHNVQVNTALPGVTINPVTTDDIINAAEAGSAQTISGQVTGAAAGSTVTVELGGKTYTATVQADLSWNVSVPAADWQALGNGELTVNASVTNAVGNTGSGTRDITIDASLPGLRVDTVAGDDVVNIIEHAQAQVITGSSSGFAAGTALTVVINNQTYAATVLANGSWSVGVPAADVSNWPAGTLNITVSGANSAGTQTSITHPLTVDLTTVAVSINSITSDDVINAAEKGAALTLSGSTSGVEAGQAVTITFGGKTYTTTVAANGSWSTTVPAADMAALRDGDASAQVRVTNVNGNSATATHEYSVDSAAPTVTINTIASDNIINASEAAAGVTVSGTSTAEAGQTLTVTLNSTNYQTTVQADGSWSLTLPASDLTALANNGYTLTATVSDLAGNPGSASKGVTVDTTAPVISFNTVAGDDVINRVEHTQAQIISGTATGAVAGDRLVVTIAGQQYVTSTDASGNWSVGVPASVISGLADGTVTISATITDSAGNSSTQTHNVQVNTAAVSLSVSTISGDNIINAAEAGSALTLSGTGTNFAAGTVVTVLLNGKGYSATIQSNGSWSVNVPAADVAALADGTSYTVSASAQDSAGNSATASRSVAVDLTAPIISINTVSTDDRLNAAEQQQPLTLNGSTSAEVGQTLTLTLNGKTYTTTVQTGGSWSYTLGSADVTALADGNAYVINASVSNAIGNTGSSNHTITVDLSAPAMGINIDSLQADTGLSASDFITSVSPVVVNGSLTAALASNETAQISIDGGVTWTTLTVTGTTWRYNDSRTLTDGNYLYQVRVIDAAGNVGATDSQNVVIDTIAPDPAVKVIAISAITTDTGLITNDFVTSDTTLAVSGTLGAALSAGEFAQISIDGGTTWQNLSVSGLTWTYLDGRTLTDGNYNYQVRVIDTAGNIGATASQIVTVDTTAPLASKTIAIAGISDDTGLSSSDFVTRDTTLTVRGTLGAALAADERAQISLDGGVTWTTLTVIGTSWSYADGRTLTDGTWNYTVRVVDLAGNVGQTATQNVVVDTTSPEAAKSITITGISDDTGASSSDFMTSDTSLTVRGVLGAALGANEFAQISTDNGATWVNVTVAADGLNWSYVDGRTLTNGTTTWQVRVVDLAGNVGATGSQSAQIDTVNPAQVLTIASISTDTGSSATDFITSDTTLTLTGSLGAGLASGEVAQISLDGGATWITLTTNGTQWTYTDSRTLTDGSYVYQVRVLDLAGNTGPVVSKTVVVDTINPTATPTIVSYTDDVGQRQGTLSSSQATDDTTPLLNGVLSGPLASGEVVYLYRNGLLLGAVTMVGALNWTYSDSGLVSGAYTYSARVVDLAGNITASSDFVLTVDTSIPTTLAQITSQTTRDTTPIISGVITAALASGQYVEVVINGKTYTSEPGGAVMVDPAHNTWYVQLPDTDALTVSATAYTVTAQVKSSAGNGNNANISNGTVTVNAAIDYTPTWTTASKTTAWGLTYGLDSHGMWTVLANQQVMQSTDPLTWSKTALTLYQSGNNYATSSIADYDRNGTGDLFITRDDYGTGYINGFTNNGDGTFSSAIQVTVGTLTWYGSIVAFDKEGDGYLDFWIGDAGGPDSNTFLWNNAGTLVGNSTTSNSGGSATVGGAVTGYLSLNEGSGVDLNNDGRIDLVQHTYNLNNYYTLSSLINQGNGTFVWGQNTTNTFLSGAGSGAMSSSVSMTWADFDGDGDMDLFLPASQGRANYGSLLFNTNGVLGSPVAVGATATTYASQFSVAVDWNHDGLMDIARIAQTGQSYLYTNVGGASNWTQSALGGSQSGTTSGVAAMDYDWDGAVDVLVTKQSGSVFLIRNTNTVSYGTSLHLRITDPNGINVYYGNTVKLYNSAGVLVATQIINPQSGMGVNDTSALVNFYGLNAGETYNAVLIKSTGTTASNIDQTVNTSWGGLQATDATHAYDLSAEAGTASNNGKFVGTGYNDTFFATAGTDTYDGSGGWVYSSGTGTWLANGGMDVVDFRLSTVGVTANLSSTAAQATGFNTSTFTNIEGISGSNFNDTLTGSSGDNQLEGRGGNDTLNIGNGGHDTLLYKLLNASDATGGNGSDVVNGFTVGTWEGTADTDRIDIRELLQGSGYTGNGKASYVNGVATLDAQAGNIGDFVKVTQSGSDTIVQIDRDGTGGNFATTNVVTLTGVHTDLATLLANHQLMVV
ncbi:TPA: Ig-like domain-containing protein [Escherichia coli]|nr:Ig-like domain-containing protein [Escherichia coli]